MTFETINQLLGPLTLGVQILLALILIALFFFNTRKNRLLLFISQHALPTALIIALTATLGSLIYSEVIELTPCKLCWVQRIFLFPQVFLLGLAYYKDDRKIIDYSILLSIIGLAVALFHYWGQFSGSALTDCSAGGTEVSCNVAYITYFGYITIPLMSATTFASMIIVLLTTKFTHKTVFLFRR